MTWKPSPGIAIAIHPFIASGEKQLSLLTGDYLIVYDECKDWYHGQNIYSECEGIFPKSYVSFTKSKRVETIDASQYMLQEVDLLQIEAQMTLNFALSFIDHENNHQKVCEASKYVKELVDQLQLMKNDGSQVYSAHKNISVSIDKIRELLGLPKAYRTKFNEFSTFTNWGPEQFSSTIITQCKEVTDPDYAILHFHVELDGIKKETKEQFYTFYLYQSVRLPWISEPVSVKLGPENPECDLFFDYLEKKNFLNEVHLVVYIYDYSEKTTVNRDIAGIGFVRLPSLKADVAFKKGPSILRIEPKSSESNIFMYGGHEYLISGKDATCNESLRPITPTLKLTFTPYFGQLKDFIDKQVVAYPLNSNSFFLPTVIPAKKVVSKLHVYISGIKEKVIRKNEVVTARLFDITENTFQEVIQNSYTGKESKLFSTVSFNGVKEKEIHLAETFCFDLSNYPPQKLKNFYILFELKTTNESTGSAFALVHIADQNGFIEQSEKRTVEMFQHSSIKNVQKLKFDDFKKKDKQIATLTFSTVLSSSVSSSNKSLMKLLNYTDFDSELESILKSFKEIPMFEWCKFFKPLAYNLIKIINSKQNLVKLAFDDLIFVISEILTRGRKDYINEINELIFEHFNPESHQNEENFEDIKGLYEFLVSEIAESIKTTDTQLFRNILKCSSYLFDMSMKSIMIYNTDAEINLEPIKKKLKSFFKQLNDVVSKIPESNDALNSGTVFTDQQLILQHFPNMIIALTQCIDPQFLGKTIVSFIRSIRYVKDDKKQIPLDKSKMKILYLLSSTPCWTNPESRKMLQDVYKTEIEKAAELPLCSKFVAPTIGSLFITSRDEFAIQFIELLFNLYKKDIEIIANAKGNASRKVAENDAGNIAKVLMLIAYKFPDKVPYEILLQLMRSEHLTAQVRLFNYANFVFSGMDKFESMLSGNSISNNLKNETITLFFALTIQASEKSDIRLVNAMNALIYPSSFDYTTCRKLYEVLPKEAKVNPDLIEPLFHCYILSGKSEELNSLFYDLVEADVEVNSKPTTVLKPTLNAVYELSKLPTFNIIQSIFEISKKIKNKEISEFYKEFKAISIALSDYRKLIGKQSMLSTNYDKLSEAIYVLISACKYAHHDQLMPKCLLRLAELNLTCGNHVEAAKAYEMFLDYIPCNNNRLDPIYQIENATTGCELHTNVMIKIIGLYMGSGCDEYSLGIIEKMCEKVVKPYQYIDLMKTILDKETAVYQNIVTQSRKYSNFFYAHFEGEKFDSYYDNKRSFIYRKHPSIDLNSFMSELSQKYQIDINDISEDPPTGKEESHVQVFQVFPAYEKELKDPFYLPDSNQMRYLVTFSLYKECSLFKREIDHEEGGEKQSKKRRKAIKTKSIITAKTNLDQFFFRTNEAFPCMKTRVEINDKKSSTNSIEPIDKAVLILKRRDFDLKVDSFHCKRLYDTKRISNIDSSVISLFTTEITSAAASLDEGDSKQFIINFLKDKNFASNNKEKVKKLKKALKEHIETIQTALNVNVNIVPEETKDMNKHALEQVIKVKSKIKEFID